MDHAMRLASALDADIVALHAFRVPVSAFTEGMLEDAWVDAERTRLQVMMQEFLASGKPAGIKRSGDVVHVETALVEDYPEEGTASFSKRFSCDLIVMGTQGAHELVEGGLGSVATAMLRTADVPVLIIPDGAIDKDPSHIVYAVDFQDNDRDTLRFMQYMAARLDARLTLLHIREHAVFDLPDEYKNFQQTFHDLMEDDRCSFDLVRGVDLAQTLRDYLENREADLLVMRSRHRKEDEWDQESLTREMAWHARSPLLVFPA